VKGPEYPVGLGPSWCKPGVDPVCCPVSPASACSLLSSWFLLLMALAGPPKEKPHLAPYHNAGTAEPMGVSPPEAVAYVV
jgi:hypothetical protein